MKNIILIVSLLLMGVTSRADILNSSDNKNVAEKFDPMLKAALFQMKIIADTSSILLSDIDYVEDLELKTSCTMSYRKWTVICTRIKELPKAYWFR